MSSRNRGPPLPLLAAYIRILYAGPNIKFNPRSVKRKHAESARCRFVRSLTRPKATTYFNADLPLARTLGAPRAGRDVCKYCLGAMIFIHRRSALPPPSPARRVGSSRIGTPTRPREIALTNLLPPRENSARTRAKPTRRESAAARPRLVWSLAAKSGGELPRSNPPRRKPPLGKST